MKRLLILDVNQVILLSVYFSKSLDQSAGVRAGSKVVYARPFLREFLDFCKRYFDVAIWSCMQAKNLKPILEAVFSDEDKRDIKFVCTQQDAVCVGEHFVSKKPIFLKDLKNISSRYAAEYDSENVILIDDSPYKTCMNPFYSSLYPRPYLADVDDTFLIHNLIPYLLKLAKSSYSMHHAIQEDYPHWSEESLLRDWEENIDIWSTNPTIKIESDPEHLRRFSDFSYNTLS